MVGLTAQPLQIVIDCPPNQFCHREIGLFGQRLEPADYWVRQEYMCAFHVHILPTVQGDGKAEAGKTVRLAMDLATPFRAFTLLGRVGLQTTYELSYESAT